ncbi:hypothetical protein EVAR_85077_1 [Eumeta japonica]|uniref:Uncharacterized protein n=1 Tax=Eumeta variegata TaxID=151549 RepID=A0A4C1XAK4_EUMVA|nr:hypothetical protein EVAR_85077_1 [Eumeta japonica]
MEPAGGDGGAPSWSRPNDVKIELQFGVPLGAMGAHPAFHSAWDLGCPGEAFVRKGLSMPTSDAHCPSGFELAFDEADRNGTSINFIIKLAVMISAVRGRRLNWLNWPCEGDGQSSYMQTNAGVISRRLRVPWQSRHSLILAEDLDSKRPSPIWMKPIDQID